MPAEILIVDDDATVRRAIGRELRQRYSVIDAESIDQAVARLTDHPNVRAVVTDQGLKDGLGSDLLKLVRAKSREPARVLVSGDPPADLGDADAVLAKPWEPNALLSLVTRIVAKDA